MHLITAEGTWKQSVRQKQLSYSPALRENLFKNPISAVSVFDFFFNFIFQTSEWETVLVKDDQHLRPLKNLSYNTFTGQLFTIIA